MGDGREHLGGPRPGDQDGRTTDLECLDDCTIYAGTLSRSERYVHKEAGPASRRAACTAHAYTNLGDILVVKSTLRSEMRVGIRLDSAQEWRGRTAYIHVNVAEKESEADWLRQDRDR